MSSSHNTLLSDDDARHIVEAVYELIDAFEMNKAHGYVKSVVTGENVEPDHPDSPLRRAGII